MELRVLEYFLAVAQQESIIGAANALHLTQPTLSRQMRELEEEVGKPLLIRGPRRTTLTEDGILLRQRANDILALVQKTQNELAAREGTVEGDVYIAAAEMDSVQLFIRTAQRVQQKYPGIRFHFYTGSGTAAIDRLDSGLVDFSILVEPSDVSRYDFLFLPAAEECGFLMRPDAPLAQKKALTPADIRDIPIVMSDLFLEQNFFTKWAGVDPRDLNIVAAADNPYIGGWMILAGMGYALGINFDLLTGSNADRRLCFRPLDPPLKTGVYFAWKKYQVFSRASEIYLEAVRDALR